MGHGYNAPTGVFSLSFSELEVIVSIIMRLNRWWENCREVRKFHCPEGLSRLPVFDPIWLPNKHLIGTKL